MCRPGQSGYSHERKSIHRHSSSVLVVTRSFVLEHRASIGMPWRMPLRLPSSLANGVDLMLRSHDPLVSDSGSRTRFALPLYPS